jgi:hypothetical protein
MLLFLYQPSLYETLIPIKPTDTCNMYNHRVRYVFVFTTEKESLTTIRYALGGCNECCNRLVPSETQCLLENISLGRTDALPAHRLFWTVLSLSQPFNARYAVEYLFFARTLALCRARVVTIPTIRMGSLHSRKITHCIE